jgi:hypothetical protein
MWCFVVMPHAQHLVCQIIQTNHWILGLGFVKSDRRSSIMMKHMDNLGCVRLYNPSHWILILRFIN